MENTNIQKRLDESWQGLLGNPTNAQLFASGRMRHLSTFDERLVYYAAFGEGDVCLIASESHVVLDKVVQHLSESGWHHHRSNALFDGEDNTTWTTQQYWLHEGGYMLCMQCSKDQRSFDPTHGYDAFEAYESSNRKKKNQGTKPPLMSGFELFYPSRAKNAPETQAFLKTFMDFCHKNFYEEERTSKIGIISHDGTEYYVKNFSMEGKVPAFVHLDEHYGDGFLEFHGKMVERIKEESKGLILFHGDPGTGKTQYIRMLLDILTRSGKSILYVPPSFSSQLTEPQMIEFISDWVLDEEQDCILLIEDAEPLLETRNGQDGRSTGISNLLNMTDGILNDMLGLMVIATFNTSISKIDSALLRPQRLIARKEFAKISKDQAQKLADALSIPLPNITFPATLAEFYTEEKQASILVHGVKEEKKIGFNK